MPEITFVVVPVCVCVCVYTGFFVVFFFLTTVNMSCGINSFFVGGRGGKWKVVWWCGWATRLVKHIV